MHVVIIGRPDEGHIELVTKKLSVPYTVIDSNAVRDGVPLSFLTVQGKKAKIAYNNKILPHVTAVWCKRLAVDFSAKPYTVDKAYEEYSKITLTDFIGTLSVSFADAFWISPYQAMLRAYNKQYHLAVANSLGFNIPETLMTCDPQAARKFIDSRPVTIAKPFMPRISAREGGGGTFFFAAKLKKGETLDLRTLPIAPVIFQTAIDQACDVRVTVVGKKLFAASIVGNESAETRHRDWRMSQFDDSMVVKEHILPPEIADQCLLLVKKMGLVFGAVDLLLDKAGTYWFLEVNTTGAWRFIEERTGQPIAEEIAKLLSTAGKSSK